MTYLYMDQCDKKKYGSMMKGLKSQYSLKNNQYPIKLEDAHDVLTNHRWDATYKEHKRNQQKNKIIIVIIIIRMRKNPRTTTKKKEQR